MLSVSNFYHGKADDLVTHAKTFLENFHNFIFAFFFIFHMHHSIVETGVELLSKALYLADTQFFHGTVKLGHYHFHATAVSLIHSGLFQSSHQVVIYRQELFQGLCLYIGIKPILFPLAALAEVIILRADPEILVVEGCQLIGCRREHQRNKQ